MPLSQILTGSLANNITITTTGNVSANIVSVGTSVISNGNITIGGTSAVVPVGTTIWFNTSTPPTGFLAEDGSAISRTTYSTLFNVLVRTATVTITIASPGVITWTSHGLSSGDPVKFSTTGALPTGITANTTYYVISSGLTTNAFSIATTAGGTAINTSGTQSGTQTGIYAPHGDGDGSTTYNLPDSRGYFLRGWDKGAGIDTNRAFGSSQTDALQGHTHSGDYASKIGQATPDGSNLGASASYLKPASQTGYATDGTNGVPRTASETRPSNKAKLACIKY